MVGDASAVEKILGQGAVAGGTLKLSTAPPPAKTANCVERF